MSDKDIYGNKEPNITIKSDDITILIFRKILYRRCTVYLVSQSSDKGSRILAYLYSKINHLELIVSMLKWMILKNI